MSICTKCGGREIWSYNLMGESAPPDHYCDKCGKTDIADTPAGALDAALKRESELRQRIAELEAALQESRELRDDLWQALKQKSEGAF